MLRRSQLLLGLIICCYTGQAQAIKIESDDKESFLNINFLTQPYVQHVYSKAADPANSYDVFLRRTRFLLGGQINKWVGFFMETDMPNLGRGRAWDQNFIVQDAIVQFNLHRAFNLNIGMILPGFARDFFTSAAALHSFDYHGAMAPGLAYPGLAGTLVWRDTGVQALGWLMGDRLEYRFSMSTGASNPDMMPRFTGRVSFNLLEPEGKLFPAATYLGTKRVVSVGVAVDVQPDGLPVVDPTTGEPTGDAETYLGLAGDVLWDLPLGGNMRLTGQLGYLYYRLGDENQMGLLFDTGVAFGAWEPMVVIDWVKSVGDEAFADNFLGLHGGLNYWMFGHNANLKLDLGVLKPEGSEFDGDGITIQTTFRTQLLF